MQVSLYFFFSFSSLFLDGLTECLLDCSRRGVWLVPLDALEKCYVTNIPFGISCVTKWNVQRFRGKDNGGSKQAYKWACKCYQFFHDLNSTLYAVTTSKVWVLLKVINVFHSENLTLFTVGSIHSINRSVFRNLMNL